MTLRAAFNAILTLVFGLLALALSASQADATDNSGGLLPAIRADLAQTAGLTGKGVKVGVVSNGAQGLSAAQNSGALPSNIPVVANDLGGAGEAEGVALLEVVHTVAPDAQLYFCAHYNTYQCAQYMVANYGVTVIVDDIEYGPTPFIPNAFSETYDSLMAANPNLVMVHSAGNENGTYYVGDYTPVTTTIGGTSVHAQDFGKSVGKASDPYQSFQLNAGSGIRVNLNWSDDPTMPAPGTNDVLTLVLVSQSGTVLGTSSGNTPQQGVYLDYTNSSGSTVTVRAAVELTTQNNTLPLKIAVFGSVAPSYPTSGFAGSVLYASSETLVVGAAGLGTLLNNAPSMESYSEGGPDYLFYSATQTGTAGGVPIYSYTRLTTAQTLDKPDLTAPDCIQIAPDTSFENGGTNFCGTSAAAPVVAGVAALLQQAGLDRAQVMAALEQTANPVSSNQSKATWGAQDGYGVVDAYGAALTVLTLPQPTITSPAGFSATIDAGKTVSFAGTCSESGGGTISGYAWDFGNGTKSTQQNPGAVTYANAGTYTVTFNCSDTRGYSNGQPATATINVTDTTSGGGKSGGGTFPIEVLLLGVAAIVARRASRR